MGQQKPLGRSGRADARRLICNLSIVIRTMTGVWVEHSTSSRKVQDSISKNNTLRQGRPMRLAHLAHITSIANRRCVLILRHLTCRALTLS